MTQPTAQKHFSLPEIHELEAKFDALTTSMKELMVTFTETSMEQTLHELQSKLSSVQHEVIRARDVARSGAVRVGARFGITLNFFTFAYLSRLAFCVIILLGAGFLNAVSSIAAGWRTPNIRILDFHGKDTQQRTLPDLGHDVIGVLATMFLGTSYLDWFELPDLFIAFVGPLTALFIMVHPRRFLILRRVCAVFALLNFLRAFTVIITSLPDASPQCASQFGSESGRYKADPIFPTAFSRAWLLIIEPGKHVTCGDMIFSGHTTFLVLCCCVIQQYCTQYEFPGISNFTCGLIRWFSIICTGLAVVAIVATKLHYTLDVCIAIYLTIFMWRAYHHLAQIWVQNIPATVFSLNDIPLKILRWLEAEEILAIDDLGFATWKKHGIYVVETKKQK